MEEGRSGEQRKVGQWRKIYSSWKNNKKETIKKNKSVVLGII